MADQISEDRNEEQMLNGLVLPCFMKNEGSRVNGWVPAPSCGDAGTDFVLGEIYADMAIAHAREAKNPQAISFIMASIHTKAMRGEITYSCIEEGFLDRIARLAYAGSLN